MITLNFDEVLKRIYNAKKGVEVRYGLGQGFEYCKQFADEAQGHATNAKASADKAAQTVAGIEQTKTDAVQAVQNAQTTATTAITQTKDAALTDIGNAKTGALQEVASSTEAAQTAATKAKSSEQAAEKSKEAAATSASTATTKASEASTSAGAASTSRQVAEKAQKAAEDAAELAGTRAGTDKTLSIENAPADAKATGDALVGKADKSIVQDENGNAIFYSKAEVEAKIKEILAAQREEDLAKVRYWVSDDPTSPASFIGGTWERVEGEFIMGASSAYPVGTTGGSATHTQTVAEMPSHNHSGSTGSAGSHSHSAWTGGAGGHSHTVSAATATNIVALPGGAGTGENGQTAKSSSPTTSRVGDHTHGVGMNEAGAHTHTVSIGSTGSGQAMDILNPYYALYIWVRVDDAA